MIPDFVIAPFRALEGADMRRVTQFDIYLLGTIRSLENIRSGDKILDHRDDIVLSAITLNHFCNDVGNQQLLPRSVEEGRHLWAAVGVLNGKMGDLSTGPLGGVVNDSMHSILSRGLASFETTLKHELNELPTYVVEKTGIYDTDDLLSKADDAISSDLKPHVPAKALEDFKRAGACIAFELYTASGFHGYRAVDETLRAYCRHFTGGLPTRLDWGQFIQALRGVPPGSVRIPNMRTIELIDRIRAEDRNPLIHPETDLDASQANIAFDLCRTAIVFIAMDIRNAP